MAGGGDLEENGLASLSSGEAQDRRGNAAAGAAAAAAAVGTLSATPRPRSQGDAGHARESRKRPLPGSRAELRSEGGNRQQQGFEAGDVRRGDGGDGRAAVTWRGRLQGEDRGKGWHEKGPGLLSSGKKFEDLDNYLRGCAAVAGAKREKRKRGRRLGGSSLGAGSGGGNSVETGGSSLSSAEEYEVRAKSWGRNERRGRRRRRRSGCAFERKENHGGGSERRVVGCFCQNDQSERPQQLLASAVNCQPKTSPCVRASSNKTV